jgi:hypothetical protein
MKRQGNGFTLSSMQRHRQVGSRGRVMLTYPGW